MRYTARMLLAGPWWKRTDIVVECLAWGPVLLAFVCALVWHPDGGNGFADVMVAFVFWQLILAVPFLLFGLMVLLFVELFRGMLDLF